ncbi:MAG: hypothetical protein ACR65T_16235 [Methylocystis sp.]|uniref:hypothetical protein n=1 Tax=Methylocystis sp. TaxID=1911079 RepID=UPI003DA49574
MYRYPALTIAIALSLLAPLCEMRRALAQEDSATTLAALLTGHVYSGAYYRKEKIQSVQLAPGRNLLGIEFDDAEESLPVTAIIPLREVGDVKLTGSTAEISCRQPDCISFTSEDFRHAVSKLEQNPNAQLVGLKRRSVVEIGCKPENGRAVMRAIVSLLRATKGK